MQKLVTRLEVQLDLFNFFPIGLIDNRVFWICNGVGANVVKEIILKYCFWFSMCTVEEFGSNVWPNLEMVVDEDTAEIL